MIHLYRLAFHLGGKRIQPEEKPSNYNVQQ